MSFGFGPQEMLDKAQVPDKWQLTPLKNFKSPRIRARMWRTALAVLITAVVYEYLLSEGNPCFALIGAVYAVGSQFEEGFHNGINRVIGTLVGGLLVIPFYDLYTSQPFGIPDWIWIVSGLERVIPYTIARILDTGCGVLITLLLYVLWSSKYDREKGVSLRTFWTETKYAFKSYINKNRKSRKKERENFGVDDEKCSEFLSKIKDRQK